MTTKRLNRNERNPDTVNETIRKLQELDDAITTEGRAFIGRTGAEAFGEGIQALTEDTSPDRVADFAVTYDASADTGKKVLLYRLGGSAVVAAGSVAASSVDLALDTWTQFKIFKLTLYNVTASDDGISVNLRFSDDGGSTFEADAADYQWASDDTTDGPLEDQSDSEIVVLGELGNATGEFANVEITIFNPAASSKTAVTFLGQRMNTGTLVRAAYGAGSALVAGASTDVRVLASAGTLTCNYTLMGII